jgi:hypothetical protein
MLQHCPAIPMTGTRSARSFRRCKRSLRKLRTYLGRVIRDIERRIVGNEDLRQAGWRA